MKRTPVVLAFMLTRRCNIACGHCSVVSGPDVEGEPPERELLDGVRAAADAGIPAIQLTGGEPMLREELVLAMLREARRLGLRSAMTTNAFWGDTPENARRRLGTLVRAGLDQLTLSHDRWHEEELGFQPVLHVAHAAEELAFVTQINVVRATDDREVGALAGRVAELRYTRIRFYDAQPVGRAKSFADGSLRGEVNGFCRAAWAPAVTDDGRVTACSGPAYFQKASSALVLGSTRSTPLAELVARHQDDPVLQTIRAFGPARLRDELKQIAGFEQFPFRDRYDGICELCIHITANPEASAALRQRLAEPRLAAGRVAALRLIDELRHEGPLTTRHANGPGLAKLLFPLARGTSTRLAGSADRVLGRADLDWRRRADFLIACGLARPLAHVLDDPELARWAPRFFLDDLRAAATRAAIVDLLKREALERIDAALLRLGTSGVLLKGSALLATASASERARLRSTGDVDLAVEPRLAAGLRAALLDDGFEGDRDAPRTAAHHLAPIRFHGVELEIHERIMPRTWGLPEREMLERARPIPEREALRVLDAEGFVVHALFHCAAHLFAFGLKTAFDVAWTLDREPSLDWDRVTRWARASAMPRAFWTPLGGLARQLEIAVPAAVLKSAPLDRRQSLLDTIAGERLFHAMEEAFDINPFSKTGVFLLLCDSWRTRASYVREIATGEAAEARHSAQRNVPSQSLARLPDQLREAAFHFRAFRSAVTRR